MQPEITQIAIVGQQLVTNQKEANDAARFALDWVGESETDSMWECELLYGEAIVGYDVRECWGRKSKRHYDDDSVLATFEKEAEAIAFMEEYNARALAKVAFADWVKLPLPVDFVQFSGCEQGKYTQSRIARIAASVEELKVEVAGFGDAYFVSERHSASALEDAVKKLVAKLNFIKYQTETSGVNMAEMTVCGDAVRG